MKFKQLLRAGMLVLVLCAVATPLTYTWDGGGRDYDWDTCDNWENMPGLYCYPSTTSADAIIPSGGSTWKVNLITEAIDDLTIYDDVDFGDAEADPTLTVDILTIYPGVTVTITDATIVADGS